MYTLTDAETSAIAHAKQLTDAAQQANAASRGLGYNAAPEDRTAAQEAIRVAQEAVRAFENDETLLLAQLKLEVNKGVAEKLPGGSFPALLSLAEQSIALLDTDGGERVTGLVKQVLIRLANAAADEELNDARARITAQRFRSLTKAGVPDSLACQILVAEAGRPWPSFGGSSSKK